MEDAGITDTNIWRCTWKKSVSVTEKLVLYASYVIVGITTVALVSAGAVGIWNILAKPLYDLIFTTLAFLFGIPWYYYVGAVALLAIPVYSFLWCVTRDLTRSDWESVEASVGGCLILLFLTAMILVSAIFGMINLFIALIILFFISVFAGGALNINSIYRFPGAVWHHYISGRKQE